ncbi:MAG: FtsB family cell division protein [Acidimicrobiia bacterium]
MTEFFRTRAALVRATVASLILVGVLFAFVFPTRTWLAQRAKAADAQSDLTLLRDQTEQLEREAEKLRSDQEVERVAREKFGLVMPGEQAWAVVPLPTTTTTTTTTTTPPAPQN